MHKVAYTFLLTILGFAMAGLYGFTHGDIEIQHRAEANHNLVADIFSPADGK